MLGVSPDSVKKHAKFKAKHQLPFALLADTEHEVAKAYGVWQQKSMFGKKYMGIARSTFIIDRQGTVASVFENVSISGHVAKVATAVAELR